MFAAFPPSSIVIFLSVPASWRMMILPTSVEPVNATFAGDRMPHHRRAGLARTGDEIHDARRQLRLMQQLRELHRA